MNTIPISVFCQNKHETRLIDTAITFFADFFGFKWARYNEDSNLGNIILVLTDTESVDEISKLTKFDFSNKFVLWVSGFSDQRLKGNLDFFRIHTRESSPVRLKNWYSFLDGPNLTILLLFILHHREIANIPESREKQCITTFFRHLN